MPEQSKNVSIVTINLNGKNLLKDLLNSVASLDYPGGNIEVIVVDNGSSDGSVEYLKTNHPEVVVIRNKTNMGFAYPCNQGAAAAKGDYIAFVNNDMQLEPDWLKTMVRHVDPESGAVCVASRILNEDGTRCDFMGGGINFVGFGFQKDFGRKVTENSELEPKDILFACGGAMLIDRNVFLDAGGFDEDYFAFYEDVDLGWRLWILGYRVVFAPDAVAYHKHHQTANKFPAHKIKLLCERNVLYTIYKNYSDEVQPRVLSAAFLLCAGRSLLSFGIDPCSLVLGDASGLNFGSRQKQGVLKKARELYRKTLGAIFGFLMDFKLNTWGVYPRSGVMPTVAMVEFATNLEKLETKRKAVQSRRKRTDEEVSRLFEYAFNPKIMEPPYIKLYDIVKRACEAERYICKGPP